MYSKTCTGNTSIHSSHTRTLFCPISTCSSQVHLFLCTMRPIVGLFGAAFLLLVTVTTAQEMGRCVGQRLPSCSSYFTDFVCDTSVPDFCSTILDTCELNCGHGCRCSLQSLGCTTLSGGFITICESEVSCVGSPTPCELLDEDECRGTASDNCEWERTPASTNPPTTDPPTTQPPFTTPHRPCLRHHLPSQAIVSKTRTLFLRTIRILR